jgi:hypothetical protein
MALLRVVAELTEAMASPAAPAQRADERATILTTGNGSHA